MPEPFSNALADVLVKRAASIGDPAARVGALRALLSTVAPDELREALRTITQRAGLRDTGAQLCLLAVAEALAALRERGGAPGGGARLQAPSQDPDWGTGRPLTLGERKSLARRPERRLLERALRDGHPDVVAEVLVNPRLTEGDVARMCAAPGVAPEVLSRVFASPRWMARPRVRRAIAANPAAPLEIALALVPLLTRDELREIARDVRLANRVRALALEVLRRLPPTPRGPEGPQ